MSFLHTYHRELVSAVVGASLAAVVSMGTGLYSLTKSFQYAQNKEQLSSLRKDLEFLARVRNEIDGNTQTLVSTDYRITAKFGDPIDIAKLMQSSKEKAPPEQIAAFRAMAGQFVPLTELRAPREKLVIDSWGSQIPESGDISFELLAEINDYFRRVKRINLTVERMENLNPGAPVAVGFQQNLIQDIAFHNQQVDELRKLDAVKLRNKINEQISVLSEKRKKLSLTVESAA